MTSLNNPISLPLDSNGYVKSTIWGQNMNPNVNNVAGSVSGSVASVTGAVGSVTNPVTSIVTISHQTGLSVAISTAEVPVNIGSAISITKDGKLMVSIKGYISGGIGYIDHTLTRGGVTYYPALNSTSTSLSVGLWDSNNYLSTAMGFNNTSVEPLTPVLQATAAGYIVYSETLELEVLNGDSIQFRASNYDASYTVYINDLVVQQQ